MTADGKRVAAGRANVVQVYDADSGLEIVSLGGHKDIIQSIRFSPDGRRLAAGSYQIVTLWNVPTGGLEGDLHRPRRPGQGGRRLPDGRASSPGARPHGPVLGQRPGKPIRQFEPRAGPGLAVSPDGKRLAVGGPDRTSSTS